MNTERQYFSAMSSIFTPLVLDKIALNGYSPYLQEVTENCQFLRDINPELPLFQFFNTVYKILFESYRSEYVYKNVLAKTVLLSRHSPKNSSILSEFRVGKCKADIVVINGTSTVYEIKSDYDSYRRLENQISTYSQCFDKIFVVTSEKQIAKLISILPNHVGIMTLTDQETISTIREAGSNKHNIVAEVVFDSLRKSEYITIIQAYYDRLPEVPNTQIHRVCKALYCRIPKDAAFKLTLRVLRNRNNTSMLKSFVKDTSSKSLVAYAINNSNDPEKLNTILGHLSRPTGNVLKI